MDLAAKSLSDWTRGLLILGAALLFHLSLYLAFRHHVIWAAPPANPVDFIGFKLPPPPPFALPQPVPAPVLSPRTGVTSLGQPDGFSPLISFPLPGGAMVSAPGVQPSVFSEEPGYFAVPSTAREDVTGFIFGHINFGPVVRSPGFHHYAGGGLMVKVGPHVRFGDLRKTEAH
jgi:hypothetical protein